MIARTFAMTVMLGAFFASAAQAQHTGGIGVVVTGDAALQPQMEAQVEDWLRQRGHTLTAAPLRPDALTAMLDCFVIEDLACANKVFGEQASSSELVFAKIDIPEGASRDVAITAYWFVRGKDPMAVHRVCTACADPRGTLDGVMTALVGEGRAAQGTLELVTMPAGARVTIDGKDVGTTSLTIPLAKGSHDIVVRKTGFMDKTAQVVIAEGTPAKLEIVLAEDHKTGAVPFLVGAAGAALLGTGIVLYATSEEDTGEKPEYRDTKALGIGLSAAGIVTIGVATWLYFRAHNAPHDQQQPVVSVTGDGASVGWAGSF